MNRPIDGSDGARGSHDAAPSDYDREQSARRSQAGGCEMSPDEMAAEIDRLRAELQAHATIEQARTAMTRAIYHDLKSPINTIISCIDVVFEGVVGELNKQQKEFLKKAENGLYKLASFVERLMELCKIESSLFAQNPDDILIQETLAPLVEAEQVKAREKNISLSLEIENGLPSIRIDKTSLDHIMRNLINNAVKYTPEGGSVKVSAGRRGNSLAVRVADTGVGISAKDMERLFKPFFRAGGPAGEKQAGTGLGLSIAKMTTDACGGKLEVESEPGSGSEFRFVFPFQTAES